MKFTKAGASEHGLTQQMTGSRQMEWDRERDRTQMKPIFQTASKWSIQLTHMRKEDLFEIELQGWQKVESDRAQRFKAKDDVKFVS